MAAWVISTNRCVCGDLYAYILSFLGQVELTEATEAGLQAELER